MSSNTTVSYTFRKIHSLLGIIPLAFFLTFHLVANATALYGSEEFLNIVSTMATLPGLHIIELLIIFLPLAVHGIMGITIVLQAKNNPRKYGYLRNWMFFIQRISGVIIFGFLIWHLATIKFGAEATAFFDVINGQVTSAFGLMFYVLALISTSFHLCNGLWGFGINWGILTGPKSQKYFGYIAIGLFFILAFFWIRVMFAFL